MTRFTTILLLVVWDCLIFIMDGNINPDTSKPVRCPGRPHAIPCDMEEVVVQLYCQGDGYRKISNVLAAEYRITAHYTTVKRVLKRLGVIN
jgi:hypothetical protein